MLLRLLMAVVLGSTLSGCQAGPIQLVQGDPLIQSMRYYDGQRWREVWVDEREMVEFVPPAQQGSARTVAPTAATLLQEGRGVRIWRLDPQAGGAVAQSRSAAPARRFSPVFRGSSVGGSRLALSGNIVVRFKPEWSVAQIDGWLAAQGLEQINVLSGAAPTYLLRVGGGLDALALANAIHEKGEVLYAMPEWWREVSKR